MCSGKATGKKKCSYAEIGAEKVVVEGMQSRRGKPNAVIVAENVANQNFDEECNK